MSYFNYTTKYIFVLLFIFLFRHQSQAFVGKYSIQNFTPTIYKAGIQNIDFATKKGEPSGIVGQSLSSKTRTSPNINLNNKGMPCDASKPQWIYANTLENAVKMIAGTARSMGVEVVS